MSDQDVVSDTEMRKVADHIRAHDSDGIRTANVIRDTIDQLYDGQRTGRYRWDQLYKTEKTHCGTLVEINLQREFQFPDGEVLDYLIAGSEVDCKYSQTMGGWMIPPEAVNRLCLVFSAKDDADPSWSMGLVRANTAYLNDGGNRDQKRSLNREGRESIHWLFYRQALPPNVLLQLDPGVVDQMMTMRSGAARITELFRIAQGKIVRRAVIATVAQQDDYMKRVRSNGGARTALKPEGIVILGQYHLHMQIAADLGLPVPGRGDFVSARVAPADRAESGVAEIEGSLWRVAQEGDPVVPAPDLPEVKNRRGR